MRPVPGITEVELSAADRLSRSSSPTRRRRPRPGWAAADVSSGPGGRTRRGTTAPGSAAQRSGRSIQVSEATPATTRIPRRLVACRPTPRT